MDNKDAYLEDQEFHSNEPTPPLEITQPKNILLITLRQRMALTRLDDEKLMRFQMAFNVLVNLVTDGEA